MGFYGYFSAILGLGLIKVLTTEPKFGIVVIETFALVSVKSLALTVSVSHTKDRMLLACGLFCWPCSAPTKKTVSLLLPAPLTRTAVLFTFQSL